MKEFLSKSIPFTGLVCTGGPSHFVGITKALAERNLKVPEDVSIVTCYESLEGITSVSHLDRELGREAVEWGIGKCESSKGWEPRRVVVTSKLNIRSSVRQVN